MAEKNSTNVQLVAVGSVAMDTIETPYDRRENILGGSASFACAAASFFTQVGMVGVVGSDFPNECTDRYRRFGIDLEGLQTVEGETFRWSGVYRKNMDERDTLCTALNVFAEFAPDLPKNYRRAPYLFLGNIGPELQRHVLDQVDAMEFVALETMDLWINNMRDALCEVIGRVDLLTLNESEARNLSGEHFLPAAAMKLMELGPRYVLIKKGEHGTMLYSKEEIFILPAYPLEVVHDPTGAGDAFAGGFMGALAEAGRADEQTIRNAILYGSVVASFSVEAFSLERLERITRDDIEKRAEQFRAMIRVPDMP